MKRRHYPHSDFSKETYFKKETFRDTLYVAKNAGHDVRRFVHDARKAKGRYTNGFYVYGPRMSAHRLTDFAQLAKYVARYASHPPISEGGIMIPRQVIEETREDEEKEKPLGRPKRKKLNLSYRFVQNENEGFIYKFLNKAKKS